MEQSKSEKDYVVKDETLATTIKSLAHTLRTEPLKRFEVFITFGDILKSIKDKHEFKSAQHLFWTDILKHSKEWIGTLFTPDYYRQNKKEDTWLDLRYDIKEAWAWGMLYPEEAQLYFNQDEKGLLSYSKKNPVKRLMDKEIISISTRNDVGAISYTLKKPFPNQMLKNGFLYEQTQWITEYLTVGLFTFEARVVPKLDKASSSSKKSTPSEKNIKATKKEGKNNAIEATQTPTRKTSASSKALPVEPIIPNASISKAKSDAIAQVRAELGLAPLNTSSYHAGYESENNNRYKRVEEETNTDYLDYQEEPEYSSEDLDDAIIVPAPWKTRSSNKDKSLKTKTSTVSPKPEDKINEKPLTVKKALPGAKTEKYTQKKAEDKSSTKTPPKKAKLKK